MRLPAQFSGQRTLRFNITPLIDVVFLLIIFFLLASHFVRSDNSDSVDLPHVSRADSDESSSHHLTVTILVDGSFSIGGVKATQDTILQRIALLAEAAAADSSLPELRIRADRNEHFGSIRPLIEQCARHRIYSIQFAVSVDSS